MAENDPKDPNEQIIDYREVGATGLKRFSGFIYEEFLKELTGWKGMAVYKEMGDNDATVGSIIYAIDKIVRMVKWRVDPASDEPFDIEAAQFLETCMDDMDTTWIDTIAEILSMLQYGFSLHEIVYKRRCGDGFDPTMRSKYNDGRIGWRGIPIRSQDTIYRWEFDEHGGIQGAEQLAPPHYYRVVIPAEKFLLFRTTVHKNNPEGRSIFRSAYRSWYMKKNIENIEAIGIERDLAGLPMAMVPPEILSSNASSAQKALLSKIQTIVTNVRRDEQEGIVFPAAYDANGKLLYDFKLLSTGGSRQFDTDKTIQRYDNRIAMCAMAEFLLMGQSSSTTGSKSMHADKTKMFLDAISSFLTIIAQTFNRFAVPRLFALNDMQISEHPKLAHADLDSIDLTVIGDFIQKLSLAGMPLFPDENLEKHLRGIAGFPEQLHEAVATEQQVEPLHKEPPSKITEIDGKSGPTPPTSGAPIDSAPVNQPNPNTVATNANPGTIKKWFNRK